MDGNRFETFMLQFQRQGPGLNVTLRATCKPGLGDTPALFAQTRAELLAAPEVAGFVPAPKDPEDVTLGLQRRTIDATFRFVLAPKAAPAIATSTPELVKG